MERTNLPFTFKKLFNQLCFIHIVTRTFPNQISGEEILSAISSPAQLLPLSHNTPPDLPPSAFSPAPSPLLPSGCTAHDSSRLHSDPSNNTRTVFSQISQTDWSAYFSALLSYPAASFHYTGMYSGLREVPGLFCPGKKQYSPPESPLFLHLQ